MKGNFEVRYKKDGKEHVVTWCLEIYSGIAADLYEKYEHAGCTDISVHLI